MGTLQERVYQRSVIRKLKRKFPGCMILKNDSGYMQGVPDLVVLYNDRWAMLEVKSHADANVQPNQDYYVTMLNEMSFAAFLYPENEQDVLYDLQRALEPNWTTRVSKR